jgi:hypothetical protein
MRQLYKQQLQNSVLVHELLPPLQEQQKEDDNNNKTLKRKKTKFRRGKFEGVEGVKEMRGELFGIENLFQFSTGSILQELRHKYSHQDDQTTTRAPSKKKKSSETAEKEKRHDHVNDEEMDVSEEDVRLKKAVTQFAKTSLLLNEENLITAKDANEVMDHVVNDVVVTTLSRQNSQSSNNAHSEGMGNNGNEGSGPLSPAMDASLTKNLSASQHSETIAMSILKNIGVNLKVSLYFSPFLCLFRIVIFRLN